MFKNTRWLYPSPAHEVDKMESDNMDEETEEWSLKSSTS